MTDHNPYTYETVGREGFDDVAVQVEYWTDVNGHYVHTLLVVERYDNGDGATVFIRDAADARRLKNLMAKIERRLS